MKNEKPLQIQENQTPSGEVFCKIISKKGEVKERFEVARWIEAMRVCFANVFNSRKIKTFKNTKTSIVGIRG